jgi:hypothetical protein
VGDDGELHTEIVRAAPPEVGRDAVKHWCRTRYYERAAASASLGTGSSR